MRHVLVEHGPEQLQQFDFLKTICKDNSLKFITTVIWRRNSLSLVAVFYISNNSVYCFCCKLSTSSTIGASSLSDKGLNDWENMSAILSRHEKSTEHLWNLNCDMGNN